MRHRLRASRSSFWLKFSRIIYSYNTRAKEPRRMQYRRFGRTRWNVSEIGYGMWGMAGWTGSGDEESLASLQRAVELGCNFVDTAWAYGDGHSDEVLGG